MAGMRYGMTNTFQHTAKSASCPPPIAKAPLAVAHAAQILVVFSLGLNFFRSGCCSQKTRTHIYIHCIYRREILLKTAAAKGKIMAETIKHSVTVFFFSLLPFLFFARCRFHCYCPCWRWSCSRLLAPPFPSFCANWMALMLQLTCCRLLLLPTERVELFLLLLLHRLLIFI